MTGEGTRPNLGPLWEVIGGLEEHKLWYCGIDIGMKDKKICNIGFDVKQNRNC